MVPEFGEAAPVDLSVCRLETGEEAIFILFQVREESGEEFNIVRQYTAEGRLVREVGFLTVGYLSAIAVDPTHRRMWLVNGSTGEIQSVLFDELEPIGTRLTRLVRLGDVGILEVLAYDAATDRLFVADSIKGKLYAVSPKSPEPAEVGADLGEPQALAIDDERRLLYLVDAAGRRIWRLDLSNANAELELYLKAREFRSPVGLAVASDGIVWIADPKANRLFAIGPDGSIVDPVP